MYVGSRDPGRGQQTADELGREPLVLDVTDADSIAAAASELDTLDVLVNNAGISVDAAPPAEADVDTFRRTYETNVFGVLAVTNAFLPVLRKSAPDRAS